LEEGCRDRSRLPVDDACYFLCVPIDEDVIEDLGEMVESGRAWTGRATTGIACISTGLLPVTLPLYRPISAYGRQHGLAWYSSRGENPVAGDARCHSCGENCVWRLI
jgi:hypothetical protein